MGPIWCAVTTSFTCTLKFVVKDCDPNTGIPDDDGYEDEYVVCYAFLCVSCFLYVSCFMGTPFFTKLSVITRL